MEIFGVDVTPEVYYKDGKAVKVVEFHMPFGRYPSTITYTLTPSKDYLVEQVEGVTNELFPSKTVSRFQVEEFYRINRDLLPIHLILEYDRKSVEKIVREGQPYWEVKHFVD